MKRIRMIMLASATAAVMPGAALAQTAPQDAAPDGSTAVPTPGGNEPGVGDIIVTAQKRSQRLNEVAISISAASADTLRDKGITDTADLGRLVPGFRTAPSNALTPVYILRGVGLYDSGLGASPTVSVYSDEVPFAFPVMTKTAALDLERVEVIKGPQGTLFGQNSTGGAINYIAAKPTNIFAAGMDTTYARFGRADINAFVSGPLGDTMEARLAVRVIQGGAWQISQTRPDDRLGEARELQGRLLLAWRPTDRLRLLLNLTASRDNSDTLAPQLDRLQIVNPGQGVAGLENAPLSSRKPQSADWTPTYSNHVRDRYHQAALRGEYDVTDDVTFVSITNYARQTVNRNFEFDGTALDSAQLFPNGRINAFDQEIRLTGTMPKLTWILGANYDYAKVRDASTYAIHNSTGRPIPTLPAFDRLLAETNQTVNTYAAYGNIEYRFSDHLTAHVGARYTRSDRSAVSCVSDPSQGQALTNQFNGLQTLFAAIGLKTTPVVPIVPFACVQFSPAPDLRPAGPVDITQNQDNVSWRGGLNYLTDGGTLVYGTVSRGWKGGVVSPLAALTTDALTPVGQERLDAYEAGVKIPLADRKVQFNAAAFYYDYKDKQLRTRYLDPIFALLERLENVPKSRVIGLEAEISARPVEGLNLSLSGSYLNAKVNGPYTTYNANSRLGNFDGSRLPFTPRYSGVADAQYERPVSASLNATVGISATYNSVTQTTFGTSALPVGDYFMPAYTLIDLRAGISAQDGSWRLTAFGRNITNKFYITNISDGIDTRYRYVGMPATYGLTLSLRTR